MKVYLVGGAVRDQLLGYEIKERDWVVVGSTPEDLEKKGYQRVGSDFPVFLHPKTKEEYALARTERKSSPGYYGFSCEFNPQITLEEDLLRRDLTINAMAMDQHGNIIDPYNGQADLRNKVLRHVSKAFIEDPVRVLRVARFASRYHHLGFHIAKETISLMYSMVKNGELSHLISERVWQEWFKSLNEKDPQIFIMALRECGALKVVLPEIDALFGVPNPVIHHPEIDTGIHSLLCLQNARKICNDPRISFAALVHDLGKTITPQTEWPSHHGHEEIGQQLIQNLCIRLKMPSNFKELAKMVCQYHLSIHRFFELKAKTKITILEATDAYRRPSLFEKLLIACEADAKGRLGFSEIDYPQRKAWLHLLKETAQISPQSFIAKGLQGRAIKEALHQERVVYALRIGKDYEK